MAGTAEWTRALRWMQRRVAPLDDAMRVDRWLRLQFPLVPQSFLQRQLRQRKIRVIAPASFDNLIQDDSQASTPAKPHTILHAGAVVAIDAVAFESVVREELDYEPRKARPPTPEADDMVAQLVKRLVYTDANFLVLNKPHGLAVQDGTALKHSLATYLPALGAALGSEPPRLVHRLDKETSGLLVLARHRLAAARFAELLRDGAVQKTYDARVSPRGDPSLIPRRGEISLPIDGRPARTLFHRVRDSKTNGSRSVWLEMEPVTGRKHQLRIHCAQGLDAPIVGDRKYGGLMALGDPRNWKTSGRLFLHAKRVLFPDPFRANRSIDVACEIDAERSVAAKPSDATKNTVAPSRRSRSTTATAKPSEKNKR